MNKFEKAQKKGQLEQLREKVKSLEQSRTDLIARVTELQGKLAAMTRDFEQAVDLADFYEKQGSDNARLADLLKATLMAIAKKGVLLQNAVDLPRALEVWLDILIEENFSIVGLLRLKDIACDHAELPKQTKTEDETTVLEEPPEFINYHGTPYCIGCAKTEDLPLEGRFSEPILPGQEWGHFPQCCKCGKEFTKVRIVEPWVETKKEGEPVSSNLPPGLSESQIPGCRPEDHAIEKAIEDKNCEACKHHDSQEDNENCKACTCQGSAAGFEAEEDEVLILERLRDKQEAREDGHIDG